MSPQKDKTMKTMHGIPADLLLGSVSPDHKTAEEHQGGDDRKPDPTNPLNSDDKDTKTLLSKLSAEEKAVIRRVIRETILNFSLVQRTKLGGSVVNYLPTRDDAFGAIVGMRAIPESKTEKAVPAVVGKFADMLPGGKAEGVDVKWNAKTAPLNVSALAMLFTQEWNDVKATVEPTEALFIDHQLSTVPPVGRIFVQRGRSGGFVTHGMATGDKSPIIGDSKPSTAKAEAKATDDAKAIARKALLAKYGFKG